MTGSEQILKCSGLPATSLAILALSPTILSAPTDTSTTTSAATASPSSAFKNSTIFRSPNDEIYRNLAAAGQLNWVHVNGGKKASIPREHWDAAAAKVSARSTTRSHSELLPRKHKPTDGGDVEGAATSIICYGRGALMQDSEITAHAVEACNALVGLNVPRPATKALQVWQSLDFADVNGFEGYLRYSFEILEDMAKMPDYGMCTGALDLFNNFCQNGSFLQLPLLHPPLRLS